MRNHHPDRSKQLTAQRQKGAHPISARGEGCAYQLSPFTSYGVNVQTRQPPTEQGLDREGKGHEVIPPHDNPGPAKVLPRLQGPDQNPEEMSISYAQDLLRKWKLLLFPLDLFVSFTCTPK